MRSRIMYNIRFSLVDKDGRVRMGTRVMVIVMVMVMVMAMVMVR